MGDMLDRSFAPLPLLARVLGICAAIVAVPALLWFGGIWIHDYRHPAPLGQTEEAMLQRVDSVLPPGTTVDSASHYLRSLGVETEVYPAEAAARNLSGDTLLAGGPAILAVYADTGGVFQVFGGWLGVVTLYFTPDGRLVRRTANVNVISPL